MAAADMLDAALDSCPNCGEPDTPIGLCDWCNRERDRFDGDRTGEGLDR